MNATHTPGPWTTAAGYGNIVDAESGNDEQPICVCKGPDAAANALLIASAPDLLAALKDIESVLTGLCRVAPGSGCVETLIQAARAAIAKAEGGAE